MLTKVPAQWPDRDLDRRIAAFALPALGSIAAEPAYSLADTAIVGHLGRTPLGSLAIATTALTMTAWLAIFLTTATTSAVAGLAAGRAACRAARSAGTAYLVAAVGGAAVAVLVVVAAPGVAALLGAHGLVLAGSVGYLRASAAGLPFLYLSYAGNGHLIGLADTRTPLGIAVAANVLNVVLEVILVYGVHLGLLGSAWGTVAAQVAPAGLYAAASRRAWVRPRRPGRHEITALLRDGHRLSVRTIALGVVPSRWLSTGLRTSHPQVTRRNSENTIAWSPYVIGRDHVIVDNYLRRIRGVNVHDDRPCDSSCEWCAARRR
ncbi:MAG: MATE family efflux transporter [Streptosporangiaceae bacterium]